MKTSRSSTRQHLLFIFCTVMTIAGCNQLSEHVSDESAGLNGGFEVSANGLPVNWRMYTPETVPDADFKIILDREVFREGKQSLKFEVERCSPAGGWRSPGFTNEFSDTGRYFGEGQYRLSFWIRNMGAEFSVSAGGVSAKGGDMITLIRDDTSIDDWKLLEYTIAVPTDQWLRLQLNILKPGTFWIDDLRIERMP